MASKLVKILLVIAVACLTVIQCRQKSQYVYPEYYQDGKFSTNLKAPPAPLLFPQILDHFSYQPQAAWPQRYWALTDYFNPSVGPVYLFICGQYTCQGIPEQRQWIAVLAQKTQGLILVLQHRFYGESLPFGKDSFTLDNLKLLTSDQALADLAFFIQCVVQRGMYGVNKNPWISVGGSYPGALSAWFRVKYPHLTIGAIASSAVVQAIADFYQFDEQMYSSTVLSGPGCPNAILATNSRLEQILADPNRKRTLQAEFQGSDKLTDDEFRFFWIDSVIASVQYGQRTNLCDSLANKTVDGQFEVIKTWVRKSMPQDYGAYYLSNTTLAFQIGNGARSWYYQSCTQFGYWQTPSPFHPLRSSRLSLDFYRQFCKSIFPQATLWPQTDRRNNEYGGISLSATKLFMSNGVEDPWRWATLQQSTATITSRIANCTNCAHCQDLHTPSVNDAVELKKIRDEEFVLVQGWISAYWTNRSQTETEEALRRQ